MASEEKIQQNVRNLLQTTPISRTVVKQAPDIIVYLDGLPYLINPYQATARNDFSLVPINDHLVGFEGSWDVDSLVPTCSFNLMVPAHQRHMYLAPGGQNILKPMMELQVFCKGYYASPSGNSLYHKIFWGVVRNVAVSDDGKALQIAVSAAGVCYFMQLMTVDTQPALISNISRYVVPYTSRFADLGCLQIINEILHDPNFTQEFAVGSIAAQSAEDPNKIKETPLWRSIRAGYITKWQMILRHIAKHAHIFGLLKPSQQSLSNVVNTNNQAYHDTKKSETDLWYLMYINGIRKYRPDYGISQIRLINGRIQTRLDIIRTAAEAVDYQAYQDLNGEIIFRPPLYNLDVTLLDSSQAAEAPSQRLNITDANNPFILRLPEITTESWDEDEAGIQVTREQVYGNWDVHFQLNWNDQLRGAAEFIDVPKLIQFGLREQPPTVCPWIDYNDPNWLFARAAEDVQRRNRGWRTYQATIPIRPELKLGFPVYVPHRDFYGSLKSLRMTYAVGGAATMTMTLDAIRTRPMFPTTKQSKAADGSTVSSIVLEPQPDMIWLHGNFASPKNSGNRLPRANIVSTSTQNSILSPYDAEALLTLPGTPGSLPTVNDPSPEQKRADEWQRNIIRNFVGTQTDDSQSMFIVAKDGKGNKGYFTKQRLVEETSANQYISDLRTALPYTDSKGYEVLAPFPWGRYVTLNEAMRDMLYNDYVPTPDATTGSQGAAAAVVPVSGVDEMLFAGLGTPTNITAADALTKQLGQIATMISDSTVFEMLPPDDPAYKDPSHTPAPFYAPITPNDQQALQDAATTAVTGKSSGSSALQLILNALNEPPPAETLDQAITKAKTSSTTSKE